MKGQRSCFRFDPGSIENLASVRHELFSDALTIDAVMSRYRRCDANLKEELRNLRGAVETALSP